MSKCKVIICGVHLVGDTEDVFRIFEVMNAANLERVEYDYISKTESLTEESQSLYYTKPMNDGVRIESLDPEDYAVWKLYASTRGNKL